MADDLDKEPSESLIRRAATTSAITRLAEERRELRKMQSSKSEGTTNEKEQGQSPNRQQNQTEPIVEKEKDPLPTPELITIDSTDDETDFDDAEANADGGPDANADVNNAQTVLDETTNNSCESANKESDPVNNSNFCRSGSDQNSPEEAAEADDEAETEDDDDISTVQNSNASQHRQALSRSSLDSSGSIVKIKRTGSSSSEHGNLEKAHKRPRLHSPHNSSEIQPEQEPTVAQSVQCPKCAQYIDMIENLKSELAKLKPDVCETKPNFILGNFEKFEKAKERLANVKAKAVAERLREEQERDNLNKNLKAQLEELKKELEKAKANAELLKKERDNAYQCVDDVVEKRNLPIIKSIKQLILSEAKQKAAESSLQKAKCSLKKARSSLKRSKGVILKYREAFQTHKRKYALWIAAFESLSSAVGFIVEKKDSFELHVELENLVGRVAALKNELTQAKANLENELREKERELGVLKEKYEKLKHSVDEKLQMERTNWDSTKQGLEAQVQAFTESLKNVQSPRQDECATITIASQISQKSKDLEEETEKLRSAKAALDLKVKSLEEEHDRVSSEVKRLREQEANSLTQAQQSKKKIKDLEAEKNNLVVEKGKVNESLKQLIANLEILLAQEEKYKEEAVQNKTKITKLERELLWDKKKHKFELKIVTLSNSFEKLKSFLEYLEEMVGENAGDLDREVQSIKKLSLDLTKMLQSWDVYKESAFDNEEQLEKKTLSLVYDIEAFEMGLEEAEVDFICKDKEIARIAQQTLWRKVQFQSWEIMELAEEIKSLKERNNFEANAQRKSSAERISQLQLQLLECGTKLKVVEAIHDEEFARLKKIILELQSNKKDDHDVKLVRLLTDSALDYQKKAADGEKEIEKLKGDIDKLKSDINGMTEGSDQLLKMVAEGDARIINLEKSLQDLLPQKGNFQGNIETLLPSSAPQPSVTVAAASPGYTSVDLDIETIDFEQKGSSEVLDLENVVLIGDEKSKQGYHDEATTVFDFTAGNSTALSNTGVGDEREKHGLVFLPSSFASNTPTLQLLACSSEMETSTCKNVVFTLNSPINDTGSASASPVSSVIVNETRNEDDTHSKSLPPPKNVDIDEEKLKLANSQLEFLQKRGSGTSTREKKCDACGKDCTSKSNLKQHITWTHLGLGQVRCKICNKGPYQNQSNLTKHMKLAHKDGDTMTTAKRKQKNKANDSEKPGTT